MSRSLRLPMLGLLIGMAALLSACDPKPAAPTPKATAAAPSGDFPAGIKPADSGDKVEASSSHHGPSEAGAAVGGMSGPGGGNAGGAMAPSGGDGGATTK